ncbi:MAG: pyridoxamine 5'-phosphate oxidase family protein [Clostridia bacterium]|nr:pyridoxamine 5'-phosphate oxidase family protein [Clostridia bacterium]
MNKVVEELKKVGVFYIATTENGEPRVRPFSSVAEFEGNAYICCGNFKEIYKQISVNPRIELCGMYDGGTWIRVTATAVEDNRIEAQQAVLDDPTGPKQLYTAGDGRFVTFKLTDVKALKYNFYAAPQVITE